MIKIVNYKIVILTLGSILMLMTLFVPAAHASPCHSNEQDTPQINQKPVTAWDISGTIAAVEANVVQHDSEPCCIEICSELCFPYNIPVVSLLSSSSFENRYPTDLSKTKYYYDSDFEDTYENHKLHSYYRISYSVSSSILQTTLKHRVLLI